jgi:hypothetical protein
MRFVIFFAMCLIGAGLSLGHAAVANDASFDTDRELIARFHFVGVARLAADTNAASLNAMGETPEWRGLREETLRKLALAPYHFLQGHAAGTNDFAPLISPLVDDLLRAESFVEVRGPTNEVPELMLAVRLEKDRADLWRSNLTVILTNWTGLPVKEIKAEGFTGWELKKHDQPNCLRFFQAGDWVLFGWGQQDIHAQAGMLRRIREKQAPVEVSGNAWLDLQVDWSRLASHPVALGPFRLSATRLQVEGRGDYVRPQLVMKFAEPLGLSLKPWQIPTNLIHDPIVGFTAVRGVISPLGAVPAVKALNTGPLPDQGFVWALKQTGYTTFLAAPVPDATNYLEHAAPGLVTAFNTRLQSSSTTLMAQYIDGVLSIRGLPLLAPNLRAMHEPTGNYLLAGLFPLLQSKEPMPQPLIDELMTRTNLVAYDWERGDFRLPQWYLINQIFFMSYGGGLPKTDTPGRKWLDVITPKLGTCGTETTLSAPNELTVVRNSPIGLTSLELYWLAYWLDSPGFPFTIEGEPMGWSGLPGAPPRQP